MRRFAKTLSVFCLLATAAGAKAQQGPGGPPGGGPDGGPPDPQQMQQMMEDHIKQNLGVSDDSWTSLQPLVDKVLQAQHEADSGQMMHGHPHHRDDQDNADGQGPDAQDDNHPHSAVETASTALKKVLNDKSASDEQIQTAMKAVQDAVKKARSNLEDARTSLRAAVNLRQQATLVAMGLLD